MKSLLPSLTVTVWFFSNVCHVAFALIRDSGDWWSTRERGDLVPGEHFSGQQLSDLSVSKYQVAGPVLRAPTQYKPAFSEQEAEAQRIQRPRCWEVILPGILPRSCKPTPSPASALLALRGHDAAMRPGQPPSLIELEISTPLRQKRTTSFESRPPVIGTARSHLPYFLIKQRGH